MPLCNRFPSETKQVNYESAKFLAETISNQQIVLYTMTNSGYGLGQHVDGKAVFCTEETPISPISIYGETKCDAEKALLDTQKAISLRLATVFGVSPKMRMDLIVNDFVWRAWNDRFIVLFESHFLRNFVHIRDVASALSFCVNNHAATGMLGQAYNIGNSSANMNKMNLCLAIKEQVPDFCIVESPINKDPDQRNYIVSNDKIENLGWECNYSLANGIEEVLEICPITKNANISFSDM
jgi:nucleoside-diphosphate-sugar epimerase